MNRAMLSCTFINSHSQVSDPGPRGPLIEDCCDNGYPLIPWNCPGRNGAIALANPFSSLAGMRSGPDALQGFSLSTCRSFAMTSLLTLISGIAGYGTPFGRLACFYTAPLSVQGTYLPIMSVRQEAVQ